MKQRKFFAAILCAATHLAYAATDTLDEIVVTATRIAQPLKQSLSSTTVITRQDIRESQAADVSAILRSVAGVEINQGGGMGKTTNLYLRGTNATHTLILLDGVRISSATSGTTSIQDLMLDQIERIEVVRGNVSSLYGSEAIGGVVQIFTRRGRGTPAVNVSAGMGSQGTQRLSVGFGGIIENTDFNVQASRFKTDGVSALNPVLFPGATPNPDKDGYDNTSLSANVRHAFSSDHSLTAAAFNSEGHNQYDNPSGLLNESNTSKSQVSKFSLASDNRLGDVWQSNLQLALGVDDTQTLKNGQLDLANGAAFKTSNQQLTWQNTLQLNKYNILNLGVENLTQQVTSDVAFTTKKRKADSLFAGYTGSYGSHQAQANLRQDSYSDFGQSNTGLLGYGYTINDAWRATASVSTAFKAPTLNDLFYPFTNFGGGFTYAGNPNLQPEHSRNREFGLHYTDATQHFDAAYFDNRISNLIALNPAWTTVININQARIDGLELGYFGQFGNTGVKAAVTSQNPRDVITGMQLDRRAKLHSSLGAMQQFGVWQVGGEWLYSGTREDNFFDPSTFVTTRKTLASYNVFNLTFGYAISKETKLSLRANNLTSQNNATAYGYNPLGRMLFVGLSYQ
ncbi:MAG: TonB-dependent receptor [Gallionella sp.]|nr:TonB-dependent receptor [Gallionella sp.]